MIIWLKNEPNHVAIVSGYKEGLMSPLQATEQICLLLQIGWY